MCSTQKGTTDNIFTFKELSTICEPYRMMSSFTLHSWLPEGRLRTDEGHRLADTDSRHFWQTTKCTHLFFDSFQQSVSRFLFWNRPERIFVYLFFICTQKNEQFIAFTGLARSFLGAYLKSWWSFWQFRGVTKQPSLKMTVRLKIDPSRTHYFPIIQINLG